MGMKDWTPLMNKVYLICFGAPHTLEQIAEMTGETVEDVEEAIKKLQKENAIEVPEGEENV